ncbi:hypothetical protein D3C81_1732620 [compost metagenome]
MRLGHASRAVDLVVHHDHYATALGLLVYSNLHSLVDIGRAIGTESRGWAHRAYQHDRFVSLQYQTQEERCLLHSVSAVSHYNGVSLSLVESFLNATGKF